MLNKSDNEECEGEGGCQVGAQAMWTTAFLDAQRLGYCLMKALVVLLLLMLVCMLAWVVGGGHG